MWPVLVVDDDEDIRHVIRSVLEMESDVPGVYDAADGGAALEFLRAATTPHLVLLDNEMTPLNATHVLQAVEQDAQLQQHAYVLLTAAHNSLTVEMQRLLASLHIHRLLKPFDIDTLLSLVHNISAPQQEQSKRRNDKRRWPWTQ